MDKFVASIKKKYRERLINREKQWPPCRSNKLVKLELVERGKYSTKEDEAVERSSLEYGDLFKVKSGKKPVRKVLVEGGAGIGKSTLCTSVSEDWAYEKLFQQFKLLFLLPLRHKKVASISSISDLLKLLHSSANACDSVTRYIEEGEGEKVLVIADGWDELGESERQEGSFLHDLLTGELFPFTSVVLTSRPNASAPLHRLPCIDRFIEVCGFDEESIIEYIESEFDGDQEKADRLLEQLEINPLVESVCRIPLNCAIICHLWRTLEEALPITMTELYTKIILNVILRNICKIDTYSNVLSLSNFDSLPNDLQKSWWLLCEFAFQALKKNRIVFSQEALDEKILCFGLLQQTESIFETGSAVSFHFLHLTFQEYLAALHLAKLPPNKQLEFLRPSCLEAILFFISFTTVWRFFFGINFEVETQGHDTLQVASCVLDMKQFYHNCITVDICHYAFEARNDLITGKVIHLLSHDPHVSSHRVIEFGSPSTADDCTAIVYVITNMKECSNISIDFDNVGVTENQIRTLTDALASKDGKLQVKQLTLSGSQLSDESIEDLFCRASAAFCSLVHVDLKDNQIGAKSLKSFTAVLPNSFREVSYLDLSDNCLEVPNLQTLEDAVRNDLLCSIVDLNLQGSLDSDADIDGTLLGSFVDALYCHCPCLSSLNLSENNLGVSGASAFARVISQHRDLISTPHPMPVFGLRLQFNYTSLGDEGLSAFVKSLEGSCCFDELELVGNDIRATGVSCLADALCSGRIVLQPYAKLYLDDNPLGLEGALVIGKMLSSSYTHNLCRVTLCRCQLTPAEHDLEYPDSLNVDSSVSSEAVRDLGQQLCQMPQSSNTVVLHLGGNSFSGENIHILVGFMHLCPCLRELDSSDCGITSDDLKQLIDRLAQLKLSSPSHFSKLELWELYNNEVDDSDVSSLKEHLPSGVHYGYTYQNDTPIITDNPAASRTVMRRWEEENRRPCKVRCYGNYDLEHFSVCMGYVIT